MQSRDRRRRDRPEQVDTRQVPLWHIMTDPDFERGLREVRTGIAFDWRIDAWNYERGRFFGHIAPLDMPLRAGGGLNPKAFALCKAAFDRNMIL